MTAFAAIVKLTLRSAIRSHVFQMLLLLLLLCTIVLPMTVVGDGTAWGFIQVSLRYTLGLLGFITSVSTVWLSCHAMTADIDSYQIHMIVAKPVSRITIWTAKCAGVILIHVILLFTSATVVYGLVIRQFRSGDFKPEEKNRIENEVLVGRKAFFPVLPDIAAIAREEYRRRLQTARNQGANVDSILHREAKALGEIRKEILASLSEVMPGPAFTRFWLYEGLDPEWNSPLFLRYRPYIEKIAEKNTQRQSMGIWSAEFMLPQGPETREKAADTLREGEPVSYGPTLENATPPDSQPIRSLLVPKTDMPETILCGSFSELTLRPEVIQPDGRVVVAFTNFDPEGKPIFFQIADGPKLLVRVCGFETNFFRAVFLLVLRIAFLAGLSCAVASIVSMPVAIFTVASYMLFGFFATYLLGAEQELVAAGAPATAEFADWLGGAVSRILLVFVIPLQGFDASDLVSGGELVEWSRIARCMLEFLVLRGLPITLLGLYLYQRREMGMAIRR